MCTFAISTCATHPKARLRLLRRNRARHRAQLEVMKSHANGLTDTAEVPHIADEVDGASQGIKVP